MDHLEKLEDEKRKVTYDLDSEKNERRRLQQLVDQLRDDLSCVTVSGHLNARST